MGLIGAAEQVREQLKYSKGATLVLFLLGAQVLALGLAAPVAYGARFHVTCGTEIQAPGSYLLGSNLNCGEIGVVVASGGVTLDCAGHSVSSTYYGIWVSYASKVTVENCKVSGGELGFYVQCVSQSSFENDVANGASYGFYEAGGDLCPAGETGTSNSFVGDSASGSSVAGFEVYLASSNLLKDDTSNGNSIFGFYLAYSSNSQVVDSSASHNGGGDYYLEYGSGYLASNDGGSYSPAGFYCYDASNNVFENDMASHDTNGFQLDSSCTSNAVLGNAATDNYLGFAISQSNLVDSNLARGNAIDGFIVDGSNSIGLNRAISNGLDGFYVSGSYNSFAQNAANSNVGYGFDDRSSGSGTAGTGNSYTGNTCNGLNDFGGAQSFPSGLC